MNHTQSQPTVSTRQHQQQEPQGITAAAPAGGQLRLLICLVFTSSPAPDLSIGYVSTGIPTFELVYGLWVEEQQKKNCELRNVLRAHISDTELCIYVDSGLKHYYDLFCMQADAAKADVFYLMSGMWRTLVERFLLWIGGFRPSELLQILMHQLEPLTEQQLVNVCNLRHSCQQAEDGLPHGMEKLQQTMAHVLQMI